MSVNLYDTIRRIVREEMKNQYTAELAVVQEQHPHKDAGDTDNYACTVGLRDSGLVLKQVPVATPRLGTTAIPPVGALVMVQFIGGDLNRPVITGTLYNDEDRPPPNDDGKAVWHLPLGAADDDAVHAELLSGEERALNLNLGSGLAVTLSDDDPVIAVDVDGGAAKLTIARDGAVTLETSADISLKGGQIGIQGSNIEIKADGTLDLKGSVINLN